MSRLWTSVVFGALGALAAGAIVVGTSGGGVDEASASHGGFHVSAGQLKINQRISQAAVRRVNEATERLDIIEAEEEQGDAGDGSGDGSEADGPTVLWAVVNNQGGLMRGRGAEDSFDANQVHGRPGVFEVQFDRDVTGCAYTANVADPGETRHPRNPADQTGTVIPSQREFWPNRVLVETFHWDSEPMRKAFHLTVTC